MPAMTGLRLLGRLPFLFLSLPSAGRTEECVAALSGRTTESGPVRGLDLMQRTSEVQGPTVLLAEEDEDEGEDGPVGEGDQDGQPHSAEWYYYMRYINGSGYVPELVNDTEDNATDPQPGGNGTNGTGNTTRPPRDGSWPWPGGTWPPPIVHLPDPVPCVSYNDSHPLVQKQLRGEILSHWEVVSLIEAPTGYAHMHCLPAPGTRMIKTKEHKKVCLLRGLLYTVCFTERGKDQLRCGIFAAGAAARRAGGAVDCLGGCNEGRTSCNVRKHRGACFTHDLCSIVKDASGFTFHRDCGDEAWAAVRGSGKCSGPRW